MSDIEGAWDEVHAANTMGWRVGRPYLHDERRCWEQYAFDPAERPDAGKRSREWVAIGFTEVDCVREMARCLRELREGRWPRSGYAAAMKLDPATDAIRSLLDDPSPAVLVVRREDREPLVSPVWYRVAHDAIEVVVAITDGKLEHLRRDPRCTLMVFEAVPPFRGVQARGVATLLPDAGARTRLAIASRYLGPERGPRYADIERRPPGVVVRLPLADARAWDLADKLP